MSRVLYQPTWESLNEHKLPKWFMDAKLGIFIHWGVYSVPAWAPTYGEKKEYYNETIGHHPYAELYGYGMMYKNTPVWKYHVDTYGADFQYEDFIPRFTADQWNPHGWASLFKNIGAKYVVLVTKHSDGYCMWPTKQSHLNSMDTGPHRDITGELTKAVTAEGMKMGLYYSLTFNWYYPNFPHILYRDLSHKQMKELIDSYKPDLLWSDDYWKPHEKSYAATWQSKELISYFYNQAANPDEVLVNDRWGQEENGMQLGDFSTPEYSAIKNIPSFYWEMTRGLGISFGYNQNDEYMTPQELINMFVDVVSKNGNLLLNVGPKADGTLDAVQVDRLLALGAFMHVNSEAIYGTRAWVDSEGETADGSAVRFTTKDDHVFATVLGADSSAEVTIKGLFAQPGTTITLLGTNQELAWTQQASDLSIELPGQVPNPHAYSLKITPEPFRAMQKPKISLENKYGEIFRRSGFLTANV
ncbi:alpha-L-fucosidase [Paenibacillus xerothermodurans]|nr:alpha-L-fucosidase [Paenibacillus xerothermodurans]